MDKNKRVPETVRKKKNRNLSEEEIRRRKRIRAKRESERKLLERLNQEDRKKEKVYKSNNKKIYKKIFMGIAVVLALLILSGIFSIISFFNKIDNTNVISKTPPSNNSPVNILVLGMDIGDPSQVNNQDIKRTDTMMVVNYNPNSKTTKIISIPRDILVKGNGGNYKINAAYQKGGEGKVKEIVDEMLEITINYVVKIDYAAFRDFVDAIGGVEMEIDRNMIYDDEGQNLHINFTAGTTVHLDGQKAEEFFRWRKNNDGSGFANGDLDRINNQHKLIEKITEKCSNIGFAFKIPKILNSIAENMETNMSAGDIINYGMKSVFSLKNGLEMKTLVGTPKTIGGQDYLVYDKESNAEIISSLYSNAKAKTLSKEDVKIIILNGTNVNGLASQVKTDLSAAGYKRIDTGNGNKISKSVIMTDDSKIKDNILELLPRISKSDSKSTDSNYKSYDVVIMLGEDYKK